MKNRLLAWLLCLAMLLTIGAVAVAESDGLRLHRGADGKAGGSG